MKTVTMDRLTFVFCAVLLQCFHYTKGQEGFVSQDKFYSIKGRAAYLPCAVNSQDARWDYDSTRFGRRARVDDSKMLIINNVLPEDAGEYTCLSSLGRSSVKLIVMDTSEPLDLVLNPVTSSMLSVTWETPLGTPEAIKSYNIIVTNPNVEGESKRLLVSEFSPSGRQSYLIQDLTPGAVYRIVVFGRYGYGLNGTAFHVAGPSTVEVIEMPGGQTLQTEPVEPPRTASTLYAILESAAILTCDRIANNKDGMWEYDAPDDENRYSIRYRPDKKQLILTIPRPQMEDAGDFTCVSSGGRSTVRLVVIDRRAPQFLRAEAISTTEVKLSWTAPQGPTEYITKYEISFNTPENWNLRESALVTELSDDGMETFTLENLTPGETYQIRVTARYRYGVDDERSFDVGGPASNIAEVTLPSGAPSTKASPIAERPRTASVLYSIKDRTALLRCFGVSEGIGRWAYDENQFQARAKVWYDTRTRVLFMSINSLRPDDAGKYDCVSGEEKSTIELIVLEPAQPQRLTVRAYPSRPSLAQVYWLPPPSGPEHVKRYSLKVLAVGTSREASEFQVNTSSTSQWTSHVLRDLAPGLTYDIEVQAIYFFGENAGGPDTKGPPALTKFQVPSPTQRPAQESTTESTTMTTPETTTETTTEQTTGPNTTSDMESTTEAKAETTQQPRTTPRLVRAKDVMPLNVEAAPLDSTSIRVRWILNMTSKPDLLIAYRAQLYSRSSQRGQRIQRTADTTQPRSVSNEDGTSTWEAVFTSLPSNDWYYIHVRPLLRSGFQPTTRPISVYLRQEETGPLSVSAVAMSCCQALVSYRSVSGSALREVRLESTEENPLAWSDPSQGSHDRSKQYFLVADLKPGTTYFFKVTATIGSETFEVVTHVITQSKDSPRAIEVTAVGWGDSRIRVNWDKPAGSENPLFYKVSTEERQQDNTFKPLEYAQTEVVFGYSKEAVVAGVNLDGNNQYRVSVTPYDLSGAGQVSEMVLIPGEAEESDKDTQPGDDTRLQVVVLVVKEDQATLTMNVTGQRAHHLLYYRVRVNHVTPHGPHHKEQVLIANLQDLPLTIESLKPHRTYEVIVHAVATGVSRPMLTEKVYVRTSDSCKSENQTYTTSMFSNYTTEMPSATSSSSNVTRFSDTITSDNVTGLSDSNVTGLEGTSASPLSTNFTASFVSSNISLESTPMSAVPTNATIVPEAPREALQFTISLPDELTVRSEDTVDFNCSVTGSPVPTIRFYKDGQLAVESDVGADSINFHDANISSSYTLQCIAYNDRQMLIQEVQVVLQEPENVSVEAYVVPVSETEVTLRWMISSGDLDSVSLFVLSLFDDQNNRIGTAFRKKDDRSFNLNTLQPNTSYSVVLQTIASGIGLVDEDTVEITTEEIDPKPDDPVSTLHLDVTEIRDTNARLRVRATGPIATNIMHYLIDVNLKGGPGGNTMAVMPSGTDDEAIYLMSLLNPESEYEVLVRAESKDSKIEPVNATTEFNTSSPGVSGSSILSKLTASEMGFEGQSDTTCPQVLVCPPPADVSQTCLAAPLDDSQNRTAAVPQEDQSMTTQTSDVSQSLTNDTATNVASNQPLTGGTALTEQPTAHASATLEESTSVDSATTEQQTLDVSATTEESTTVKSATTEQPTADVSATTEESTTVESATTEQPTADVSATTEESTTVESATTEQPTADVSATAEQQTTMESATTEQQTVDVSATAEQQTTIESATTDTLTTVDSVTTEQPTESNSTTIEFTTEPPKNYSHSLAIRVLNENTGLHIMWFVTRGDIDEVEGFNLQVLGPKGDSKLNTNLTATVRALNVQKADGFNKLIIQLTALNANGEDLGQELLDVDTTEFPTEPELVVEVNEILETSVRILWLVKGVESSQLQHYRIIIRKGKPENRPMLDRKIPPRSRSTKLKSLRPNTNFFMTVEAVGKDPSIFLSVDLNFTNPKDIYGTPVRVSSLGDQTTAAPTQATSTPIVSDETSIFSTLVASLKTNPIRASVAVTTTETSKSVPSALTDLISTAISTASSSAVLPTDMSSAGSSDVSPTDMSAAGSSDVVTAGSSDVLTTGNSDVLTAGSSDVLPTDQSTKNTDITDEDSSTMITSATEITTSEQCSSYLEMAIKKMDGGKSGVFWSLGGDLGQDVQKFRLTIYEQGIWDSTEYLRQEFEISSPKSAQVILAGQRTSYTFVLEAISQDETVIAEVEKEYFPDEMEDVERASSCGVSDTIR